VLTLLLTRHGHTVRSEPDQYLGQSIVAPLSERGRADAQRLAERLAQVRLDRVLTSPLERATETASICAAGRVAVEPDDRLKEMDYGAWEGMVIEEIQRRSPADFALYDEDPSSFHVGGGESGSDLALRVRSFIDDLLTWWEAADGQRTVLAVGHASLNRVMLAVLLETPLRDYRRRFQFDWAGLTILRWASRADGPTLLLANDVSHLRDTADPAFVTRGG
jgi:phosphoserine phosphatase